ncbi:FG-GAP repeat domain-containing protein [Actomonas aquatica]|uniref:FG-GAP-like repeat-containing protein n=1 Tax=Actomonas aquatica TaxID=2866162 RepID=A0ABZ1C5E9_9BACT|nr:VCBS repeat-containing protein [Opitutus sp. WL0086]WRQ86453.1 FG-GAP-like repeat-containing protein [Opitutus sp. WL0086]
MPSLVTSAPQRRATPLAVRLGAAALLVILARPLLAQSSSPVEFATPASIPWAGYDTTVADVDGDGDFDTLGTIIAGNELRLNRQTSPEKWSAQSFGFDRLGLLADVTGDGSPDVIAIGRTTGVEVHANNGNGTFTKTQTLPNTAFTPEIRSQRGAAADVDGDGDLDLMITSYRYNQRYHLLLNDGTGNFTVGWQSYFIPGEQANAVKFADLDNDGDPDFVAVGGNRYANVWINNGDGTFDPGYAINGTTTTWFPGITQGSLDIADLNGDGRLDLIVAEDNYANDPLQPVGIAWYENTGDLNTFTRHLATTGRAREGFIPGETRPYWYVAAGDLDGDGDIDFVASGDNTPSDAFVNDGQGNFTKVWESTAPIDGVSLVPVMRSQYLVDLDDDGQLDYFGYGSYTAIFFGDNLVEPPVRCEDLVEELMAELTDLDAMLTLATDQIAALNQQLAAADADNTDLTAQLAAAQSTLAQVTAELDALNADHTALQANHTDTLAELASANTNLTQLDQRLQSLNDTHAALVATHNTALAEIADLQSALATAQTRISDMEDDAAAVAAAVTSIEEALSYRIAADFVIPGDTADEKLAVLAEALADLNRGQRKALLRDLGYRKAKPRDRETGRRQNHGN